MKYMFLKLWSGLKSVLKNLMSQSNNTWKKKRKTLTNSKQKSPKSKVIISGTSESLQESGPSLSQPLTSSSPSNSLDSMNVYGPYFSDKELKVHEKLTPNAVREKMYLLVKYGLNRIRQKYGPVIITSGYRSEAYNESLRLKGYNPSKTSQHCTGEAVDINVKNADNREVFEWLREWWPGQLFYYAKRGHIHIALPRIDLQVKGRLYALVMEDK